MIHRGILIVCMGIALILTPFSIAGDTDDNVVALLKEIESLKERIKQLEEEVSEARRKKKVRTSELPSFEFTPLNTTAQVPGNLVSPLVYPTNHSLLPKIHRSTVVDEVMNLQYRWPGRLLNGLSGREEQLRGRFFPPEIYVLPTFCFSPPNTVKPQDVKPLSEYLNSQLAKPKKKFTAEEVQKTFEKGLRAEQSGKFRLARAYFLLVTKRAAGTLREAAEAKLDAVGKARVQRE